MQGQVDCSQVGGSAVPAGLLQRGSACQVSTTCCVVPATVLLYDAGEVNTALSHELSQ